MVSASVKQQRRNKLIELLKQKMITKYKATDPALANQLNIIIDDVMSLISDVNVTKYDLGVIDGRCKNAWDGFERASGRDPR